VLYLTRKLGETIVINETVEVTVVSVSGKTVKLGFLFPPGATVLRKEVYERIQSENRAAAENALPLRGLPLLTLPKKQAEPPTAPSAAPSGPPEEPKKD